MKSKLIIFFFISIGILFLGLLKPYNKKSNNYQAFIDFFLEIKKEVNIPENGYVLLSKDFICPGCVQESLCKIDSLENNDPGLIKLIITTNHQVYNHYKNSTIPLHVDQNYLIDDIDYKMGAITLVEFQNGMLCDTYSISVSK